SPCRGKVGMGVEHQDGSMTVRVDPSIESFSRQLRRGMTDAEMVVWRYLRSRQRHGIKFRRQHPIGPYIADFACLDPRLMVEIDGGQHSERAAEDARRTRALQMLGYQVLRFWNNEVLNNAAGVVETIDSALLARLPPPQPFP